MKEVWRYIKGYEGFYQVSNLGNVRSLDRIVKNHSGFLRKIKGALRKPVLCMGYPSLMLYKDNNKGEKVFVHRLVAEAFIPNPRGLKQVDHIDFDRTNASVKNLQWITNMDNNIRNLKNRPVKGFTSAQGNKFQSSIKIYGELYYLGRFDTAKEAQSAYRGIFKEWWGFEPNLKPNLINPDQ